ncbi:hypothetical protein BU15DRAFT_88288 [Melanogaster broomeanus]|nr:hypothetical protein BU15DRAFT_88288 [Melanogaster broomeanus]
MSTFTSLGLIPQERPRISFGPPSGLLPLLLTCRSIYQSLSFEANPYLYARIFAYIFDTRAAIRRLGAQVSAPRVLAKELRKRWIYLKLIRDRSGSRIQFPEPNQVSPAPVDLLWLAYLMMLENDGKNEQQLRDYADMDSWLMEYWFDEAGGSSATNVILRDSWPLEDEKNSVAMWLFWLMLRPDFVQQSLPKYRHGCMTAAFKLIALSANRYPICQASWVEFVPEPQWITSPTLVTHFSETYRLKLPAIAPPAILSFLTIASHFPQPPPSFPSSTRRSEEWDRGLAAIFISETLSRAYSLGSMEGVWEGLFTYMEFSAYTSLLSGSAPSALPDSLVAQHRQTWKLREYHLTETQDLRGEDSSETRPLGMGDHLKAYFPIGTRMQELADDSIEIREPGREDVLRYWRPSRSASHDRNVVDIVLVGEVLRLVRSTGHSAWGQFSLYGRIRPLDGFISFFKEYLDGDRGKWLYRGYLVGNVNGHVSGRWRDTFSPRHVSGYEGCFMMSRRR